MPSKAAGPRGITAGEDDRLGGAGEVVRQHPFLERLHGQRTPILERQVLPAEAMEALQLTRARRAYSLTPR